MNKEVHLRVLLLAPLPPPIGGIATWTVRYIEWMRKGGYHFDFVNTSLIRNRQTKRNFNKNYLTEIKRTISIIRNLRKKINTFNPNVIHLTTACSNLGIFRDYFCAKIVKKKNIKLIVHYRCNIEDQISKNISKKIIRKIALLADLNLVLNTPSKKYLDKLATRNTRILANFIENDLISNQKHVEIDENIKNITFVGHVRRSKGIFEIIEAAKFFPNIKFNIAGPTIEEITNKNLTKNINIMGPLERDKIFDLLIKSDLFLFPTYTEGFSNAILEAMCVGLPIITTRVGANEDMIENSGGFFVRVGSVEDIKNGIEELKDYNVRKKMSLWNINKVNDNYISDIVMNQLIQIYNELSQSSNIK